ncbi:MULTISPECIES: sensor histidine kinase [unclassified Kocuria]|uniref:sensor histidine kinase n=1 Tax=unclassified Kocuria TaxID=2649579 RepID=UPI000F873633|nr:MULTISPECIES: ATP-binding protein [unclassified Kocuria]RUP81030.1 ATP-binding protein [Kocuria sp. HSID17590]RUQ06779.1 ATP-binding protein [Kocuria sp. HSID17582]
MSPREGSVTRRALSYRRVNVRLRWKRFFATTAPGELGLYTYRAHYLAMIGFGIFGVAHLIEVLPIYAQQQQSLRGWYAVFVVALAVLTGFTLFYGLRHSVRPWVFLVYTAVVAAGIFALPLAWTGGSMPQNPWISGFIILAVGAAAVLWSPKAAVLYMVLLEFVYAVIVSRVITVEDSAEPWLAAGLSRMVFGFMLVVVLAVGKRGVEKMDIDYAEALSQTLAMRRNRSETADQERIDRLIHDNVMAALLDASRSRGPLSRQTRQLASRALDVLAEESSRSTGSHTVMVHVLMDELMDALAPWRSRVRFTNLRGPMRPVGEPRVFVPAYVAHGLTQAVTEAVSNSARHSGSELTTVSMEGALCEPTRINPEGFYLRFTISDDGRGFNYHDIPGRRLGVRVSIVENIEAIGGAVDLDTAPGRGTRVTLTWPRDATA